MSFPQAYLLSFSRSPWMPSHPLCVPSVPHSLEPSTSFPLCVSLMKILVLVPVQTLRDGACLWGPTEHQDTDHCSLNVTIQPKSHPPIKSVSLLFREKDAGGSMAMALQKSRQMASVAIVYWYCNSITEDPRLIRQDCPWWSCADYFKPPSHALAEFLGVSVLWPSQAQHIGSSHGLPFHPFFKWCNVSLFPVTGSFTRNIRAEKTRDHDFVS